VNCLQCGHRNPEHAKFCLECGSALQLHCGQCQTELPAGARFCLECGTPVGAGANGAATRGAPERSPADYTPRHLADKILRSRSALEGERKRVTVLFADVKGSMQLANQLDPEVWHGILDGFFTLLTDGVHRFEGTVNQYTGDGVMALFGAPIAHEDHAQRACFAALHLLEAVRRHSLEVRREHGIDVSFRLGLNSGEVVVGKIGDDLRMDYTAAGHSVGMAQRMESLAEAGACYVSESTAALAEGYFDLEDLGEFRIKGAEDCVRVHKLLGVGAARTRFDVSRSRGLSQFVGRAHDLQTLTNALDRAREGRGAVVCVIADAGTGKSRLCFEFLEQCRAAGFAVNEGHAVAHGKTVPLLPVFEILRGYFGVTGSDDPRTAREKIAGRLLLLDASFAEILPTLFDFLGVGDPAQPSPPMEPDARQRRLFSVARGLLERTTAERPGIVLVEDLHWLDGASEAWIADWVDAVAGTHNLLLLNSRPEYRADWMQRSHYQQLSLAPLGREAICELLASILGAHPSTEGLGDAIYQRTRGNPFFAEEVVRTLIESGDLVGSKGAYERVGPVGDIRVPDSVQSLLAARIDRLPENAKRLLQTAAVIGKQFREPVLAHVSGLSEAALREQLAQLRDAEFVYEESLFPVAEYAFQHPLTQEVALSSQLQDARRRTHAAVARAIEEFDADHLEEQAATLAMHWKEAGDSARAAHWCARAARFAMRTDQAEAYRHWSVVRELTLDSDAEEDRALLGQAYTQLVNLGWRGYAGGDDTHAHFEAGRRLLEETGDKRSLSLLLANYSLVGGVPGNEVVDVYRRSVALAREIDDLDVEIAVGVTIFPMLFKGRTREALEWGDHYAGVIEANPGRGAALLYFDPGRWIYTGRSWPRAILGDVAGAVQDSDRGLALARDGDDFDRFIAAHMRSRLDGWRGEFETGLAHAQRQLELSDTIGGEGNQYVSLAGYGMALAGVGQWNEAVRYLEEAHAILHNGEYYSPYAGFASALARVGDPERGLEIGRTNLAYAVTREIHLSECWMQLDLLPAAIACGEETEARGAVARARALVDQCELRLFAPAVSEVEAEVAGAFGSPEERDRLLGEAVAGYRALGATGHVRRLTPRGGA